MPFWLSTVQQIIVSTSQWKWYSVTPEALKKLQLLPSCLSEHLFLVPSHPAVKNPKPCKKPTCRLSSWHEPPARWVKNVQGDFIATHNSAAASWEILVENRIIEPKTVRENNNKWWVFPLYYYKQGWVFFFFSSPDSYKKLEQHVGPGTKTP